jgi:hypothetical protein
MPYPCAPDVYCAQPAITHRQTQMTQKPISYISASEPGGRATHAVIDISFHRESNVALATRNRNRFSSGLADSHPFPLLGLGINT